MIVSHSCLSDYYDDIFPSAECPTTYLDEIAKCRPSVFGAPSGHRRTGSEVEDDDNVTAPQRSNNYEGIRRITVCIKLQAFS